MWLMNVLCLLLLLNMLHSFLHYHILKRGSLECCPYLSPIPHSLYHRFWLQGFLDLLRINIPYILLSEYFFQILLELLVSLVHLRIFTIFWSLTLFCIYNMVKIFDTKFFVKLLGDPFPLLSPFIKFIS